MGITGIILFHIGYFFKCMRDMVRHCVIRSHYDENHGLIQYYHRGNMQYIKEFPWYWRHMSGTGPESCQACDHQGSWNSASSNLKVFVGYCPGCAAKYHFKRGRGFVKFPVEEPGEEQYSVFSSYLKYHVPFRDMARIQRYDQYHTDLIQSHLKGFEKNLMQLKNKYHTLFVNQMNAMMSFE